jgi:hypothetical protein
LLIQALSRRTAYEKLAMDNRRKQEMKEDICKTIESDKIIQGTLVSSIRVDEKRRMRVLEFEKAEQEAFEIFIKDEEDRLRKIEELKVEEEIVLEMQKDHNERLAEQKLRQSICENSHEIRELETKLNYAYTNKERAIQLQEKKLKAQEDKLLLAIKSAEMRENNEQAEILEKEQQKLNMERAIQYNQALNNQLIESEQRKHAEYEQFLKEKELVDQVIADIIAENEKEAKMRQQKQQETKKFVEEFMEERKQWIQHEIARQEQENQKISEYAKQQRDRELALLGEKKKIEEAKSGIYEKLASHQHETERAKMELEDLRTNLALEEQEESSREKEQASLRMRIRKRLEMIEAYQRQVEYKKQKKEEEKEDEKVLAAQVISDILIKIAHGEVCRK